MGELRESDIPNLIYPASKLFDFDIPVDSDILIDDISERIVFKSGNEFEFITFDFIDELKRKSVLGSARGKQLRRKL